jgi:hypothetical protein
VDRNTSAASTSLRNGNGETAILSAADDELRFEFCNQHGLPKFDFVSNDEAGMVASFRSLQAPAENLRGPYVMIGIEGAAGR